MSYKVIKSTFLDDGGVESIVVETVGTGYTSAPTVVITPVDGGSGATAIAEVAGGGLTTITVTNPGKGYKAAPTITFEGGGGADATATAVLNDLVSRVNVYTTDGWELSGPVVIAKTNGVLTFHQTITSTSTPN